ncbi:MAG: sulfatase-like hydrolase/transferase, partial [bacterium]|nr:sulfatase-like hydrolase/transferase [bacterium]
LVQVRRGFVEQNLQEETGQTEDTIVIFTADHGDMAGGHGMFWKSTSSFYDEVATIPFIVSYPRRVKPGWGDAAASLVGICPTVLEFTGQTIPAAVQGRSLAPVLTTGGGSSRAYNFCERVRPNKQRTRDVPPGGPGQFMVRGQGWKYARYSDGEEFLYDLRKDPGETQDLAGARSAKAIKKELDKQMRRWLEGTGHGGYPQA